MAATQAESQQNDMSSESAPPDQNSDSRNNVLQNGTDVNSARSVVSSDSGSNTKRKSPVGNEMSLYGDGGDSQAPGALLTDREDSVYGQYARYHDPNADPYVARGGKPGMPPVRPPQRYLSGQSISQPTGPTPTLNSLLQSHPGAPPSHRYLNSYEQSPYGAQGWVPLPPRPYSPQQLGPGQPYRNTSPVPTSRCPQPPYGPAGNAAPPSPAGGYLPQPAGSGGVGSSSGAPQQPYSPYPQQRYPPPPRPTAQPPQQRLPFPPHQYGDVQRWPNSGAPSPGGSPSGGAGGGASIPTGAPPPASQSQQSSPGRAPPSPAPSPTHQQVYAGRPSRNTTPNIHDSDTTDTVGQNSNDSTSGGGVGGGGGGTPTSQGMRPTPSPTGSSGSRSMSPAVGQQNVPMPPRPSSSSQSDSQQQQQQQSQQQQQQSPSSQPSATQQQQIAAPARGAVTHSPSSQQPGAYSYKMAASQPQSMPPYAPQQYPQGNYSPRPQYGPGNYGGASQGGPPVPNNSMSGPGQYPSRPVPNHAQFPGYQNWGQSGQIPSQPSQQTPPSSMLGNHITPGAPSGKSASTGGPIPPSSPVNTAGSPIRPHYLKQHLQHKMGFNTAPSPSPPQGGYSVGSNGPGMGPPGAAGPPPPQQPSMAPPQSQHQMGPPPMMGPPNMGPPSNSSPAHGNSEGAPGPMPPPMADGSNTGPQDNGVSSSASSHLQHHHPVTSLVTTGPDGQPMDEASQQSTLSNASAASGEDPQCSSQKSRKGGGDLGPYSHPPLTPSNASPGTQHGHDDYELCSPSWPRTPASSPIYNSHIPQENYRSKKSDSLSKLYDMDDCPDRRLWLDKLLSFMDERRTPISACPTISKQPLDLYRLYLLVRERGGFVEVCKVTKNKTWKDIAGLLGIGASSSAAYTLRKHYTKNLLTFECHFDRGGIDPGPIIQQVEAGSKKKSAKAASVPSPGSSNSQDSFPAPGSSGASLDGYGGYGSSYPLGSGPDYNSSNMSRPPSQTNSQIPHPGNATSGDNIAVSNPFDDPVGTTRSSPYQPGNSPYRQGMQQGGPYQSQQSGYGVPYSGPPDQYGPAPGPPGQYTSGPPGQYPPGNRPVYQQYGPESTDNRNQYNTPPSGAPTPPAAAQPGTTDPYRNYASNSGNYPPPRPYGQPSSGAPTAAGPPGPPTTPSATGPSTQSSSTTTQGTPSGPAGAYPPPPPNAQDYYRQPPPDQAYGNSAPGTPGNKGMPPPAVSAQPRRHPDFAKDTQQPYPPYQHRPQMYPGWPNNSGQYRGQYPQQNAPPPQQWNNTSSRPPGAQPGPQWDQHRYPPGVQLPYQPPQQSQQQWPPMSAQGVAQSSPLRPAQRPPFRPDGKGAYMPPPQQQNKPGTAVGAYPSSTAPKRELVFPLDSVEATQPVLYRRKKLCRGDVAPVEAWRIMMALRSGLLAETCWALDVLNVLLYDDSSVAYFGLVHMPQLLELLLEHFQKSLKDVFDPVKDLKNIFKLSNTDTTEVDLGAMKPSCKVDPEDREVYLKNQSINYSLISRKGVPVRIEDNDDEIFVTDTVKKWDVQGDDSSYNSLIMHGTDPWQTGQSELVSRDYIIDCFQAEFVNIPFACQMKSTSNSSVCNGDVIRTKNIDDNEVSTKIKKEQLDITESVMKRDDFMDMDMKLIDDTTENNVDSMESKFLEYNINVRDPAGTLKRRRMSDFEDECYTRDESSLYLVTESQDSMARRCVCISTILRNLTFVPGNEMVFAKSSTFVALLGKLLLLHHEHPVRTYKTRNYDREEDSDFTDSCSSLQGENEWWWDYLVHIRENILVATSNIAGHMDLGILDEEICRPVLDGLLHWAVCPSAQGQDPFPTVGPSSLLSPQRLALEALCKLCVTDANVDLVIATPPFSRLERLCAVLTRHLCRSEDQVLREFSVNLLHYLAAADSVMARAVALQNPCVSLLVAFIEQAEQAALGVANQHGIAMLRDNPDSMGTSLDMLRRAAGTLLHLARHPDNRPLFMQQEQRLLGLVMSQILDQQVAAIISRVLYQCSAST
ncbi:trithorax group protein osa isoform X4 [Ctenocephalides felis]|uniref:trithorax group protein osa isoform X4 n=1 Tax=Ctenocephalides felis TaxID=7515 RepID=UPI000E6E4D47|nr:trithorax group protein osa isoform X4 [Ctenocephalides felis]